MIDYVGNKKQKRARLNLSLFIFHLYGSTRHNVYCGAASVVINTFADKLIRPC